MSDQLKKAFEFHQRGMFDEAAACYRKILSQFPDNFHALHFLGLIEAQKGRLEAAVSLIGRALTVDPKDASAHLNFGNALLGLKKFSAALKSFEMARTLQPGYSLAWNGCGVCLLELGCPDRALVSLSKALEINPNYSEALNNQGNAYQALNALEDAIQSYDCSVSLQPDNATAHNNLGNALYGLRRHQDALKSYGRALSLDPDHPSALYNRGNALLLLGQGEQAVRDLSRLAVVDPGYDYARGDLLHAKMQICDWASFDEDTASIASAVREGKRSCSPFAYQAISNSPGDLWQCAKTFASDKYPVSSKPLSNGNRNTRQRIRIGYVSGEFREQATSYLAAGLFELHDKRRFELFAIDSGFSDASPLRRRMESAFDHFVDISGQSDEQAAQFICSSSIDILVNLNGYFGLERTGIFSSRPSPIQVNFLGFPGTMGSEYMDYIVADQFVIHENERQYYSEQVVYLPECYQVNDSKRLIAASTISRPEAGLPANSFVFCCFNNTYKFAPEMFDIWMTILRKVENSVLWLLRTDDTAMRNLRNEAKKRGVAIERLVFAPRVKVENHLARHRLADLFLDSLPYNAHTTASDALWSGLPVLTCAGSTFPGRVAASLLRNVGLADLVTHSLQDYVSLAVTLATSANLLVDLKAKLAKNRLTHPLFDTDRFRRHIESAYITMWERYQRGDAPAGFAVRAIS